MFYNPSSHPNLKLDASDITWFQNELKYISTKQYEKLEVPNRGRQIIPTASDIPDWALLAEFTEWKGVGEAKIVGRNANDLPSVDVAGAPYNKSIEVVAASFHYTIFEIKNAARNNLRLNVMRAARARRAIETKIDRILGKGSAAHNLQGLFNLANVQLVPATTKTGGGTYWSAAAKPAEIAADVMNLAQAAIIRMQNANPEGVGEEYNRVRIVMPDENYLYLTSTVLGDNTGRTVYEFLVGDGNGRGGQPYIESIMPWWAAKGSAANGVDDRMVAFPPTEDVLGAIVPVDFIQLEEEKRTFQYDVPCYGTTGGVVLHRPVAVSYMDTIDRT